MWSEFVPFSSLGEPGLLRLLSRHGVGLIVAVMPDQIADAPALVERCRAGGVDIDLWPMLDDEAGRWANAETSESTLAHVRALLEAFRLPDAPSRPLERQASPPPFGALVLDLEPPIAMMRGLLDGGFLRRTRDTWGWIRRPSAEQSRCHEDFRRLRASLSQLGVALEAAALPFVLADGRGRGWERALATPVRNVGFRSVSYMLYSSVLEGYARACIDRPHSRWLLHACARRAVELHGARAGASLGITGPGALGDEPFYGDIAQFRDDVALVRAAGIDDLAVHGLEGILSRGPERWLSCFTRTEPARTPPAGSASVRMLWQAMRFGSTPLGLLSGSLRLRSRRTTNARGR